MHTVEPAIENPLTALLGRAQLLKMIGSEDEQVAKAVGVIEESARRIAVLIRELAQIVKAGSGERLEEVLKMDEPAPRRDGVAS